MILPLLGIPWTWKSVLIFISGAFLVLVSYGPTILKKLQTKPRQKKKQNKTDLQNEIPKTDELKFSDNIPTTPNSQEEPKAQDFPQKPESQ